ncbi:hypothetical protein DP939_42980 [Spongiactinospora rosea]|uniref:Uncharacterized protein n=1 Tax=Spongiactinospora rosea TaxID=2248750 RepID=A0A366LJK5_9ACTN|nr:hypothetical protein DP939_42980 [Spongiactinospora rosea]
MLPTIDFTGGNVYGSAIAIISWARRVRPQSLASRAARNRAAHAGSFALVFIAPASAGKV